MIRLRNLKTRREFKKRKKTINLNNLTRRELQNLYAKKFGLEALHEAIECKCKKIDYIDVLKYEM